MPKISVIVPVYNVEKYLSRCIDSILNQTFTDFELILVDDGSTDNSGEICDMYSQKDSRIIVIHQSNQGVSVARNQGIISAKGGYITFIDSDDWISSRLLERLLLSCEKNDSQMAVSIIKKVKEFTCDYQSNAFDNVMIGKEAVEKFGSLMDMRFRGPVGKLVRTSIVKAHMFPCDRKYGEDTACVYRWMFDCNKVVEILETHYFYYTRDDSVAHKQFDWHRLDSYKTYDEMLDFYLKHHICNPYKVLLRKYLQEMIDGYERCVLLNKKDIAQEIQKQLQIYVSSKFGFYENTSFETRESLIEIVAKHEGLIDGYLADCYYGLYTLYQDFEDNRIRAEIKRRIKRIIRKYSPSFSLYSYLYELVYPKTTSNYWRLQSVINELKR